MKYIIKSICIIAIAVSFTSCFERELENNENYTNLKKVESIKDNEMLRFRNFRIENSNNFLIFGNNNEVDIEGIARLPLYFYIDNGNRRATLDVTGCIYEYTRKTDEIIFRKAMLHSKHLKKPLVFDVLCKFSKVSSDNSKSEIFNLKIKQFVTEDNKKLSVGERVTMNGQTVSFVSEFSYKLVYYRN